MHVFVAGGSGQTGSLVIDILLERNHTVTALVRNPDAVPSRVGLDLVQGSPVHQADIEKAFARRTPDAVMVTLASAKGVFDGTSFLTHAIRNIVRVMKRFGTSKIVYMSSFGVGNSNSGLNFLMKGAVWATPLGTKFADHEGAESALKDAEGIEFVIVRPTMLKNGDAGKNVQYLGERGEKDPGFMPSITRASVARFMVDAAGGNEWVGKTPVIRDV